VAESGTFRSVDRSITDCFRETVALHGARPAVRDRGGELSFADLDEASDRLALTILAELGPGSEPVAMLLRPERRSLVALLAMLKAGKFYVPFDPTQPERRLGRMAGDIGPAAIIASADTAPAAANLAAGRIPVIDVERLGHGAPVELHGAIGGPDSLAFVLYSSGTTGEPKGALYTHRTALHCGRRFLDGQRLTHSDRVSLLTGVGYGAAVGVVFSALMAGAALCVFDPQTDRIDGLEAWLRDEAITIFSTVPTLFRHVVSTFDGTQRFPSLRLVRLGGDSVRRRDIEAFEHHFGASSILHIGYGASEIGVVRERFFSKGMPIDEHVAGDAVEGMEILILDAERRPVPAGEVGEIAVRSRFLGPGYWRNPSLTARVFLPDPDGGDERIYLTGDLGSIDEAGRLLHHGRRDAQVKIRGHRVELEAVELAIRDLPGVLDAVILVDENDEGERRLHAHLVTTQSAGRGSTDGSLPPAGTTQWRRALRHVLPEYMVPARFSVHVELPRQTSGKLDRERLRSTVVPSGREGASRAAARTDVEARLCRIWQRVLGVPHVGLEDDFFALGGDSMVAADLCAAIDAEFALPLTPSAILDVPTVERMAHLLDEGACENSPLVPISLAGAGAPFFCVHGIQGNIFGVRDLARHLRPARTVYGLKAVRDSVDRSRIDTVASHYLAAIRRLQPRGPYTIGGYSFGGVVAFEMARQLVAGGETVERLILLDAYGPNRRLLPAARRILIHAGRLLRIDRGAKVDYVRLRARRQSIGIRRRLNAWRFAYGIKFRGAAPRTLLDDIGSAHRQAARIYVASPYAGRIDLFRAADEVDIWHPDPCLGWTGLSDDIRVHDVPGDHLNFLKEPYVRACAAKLSECLAAE
jgi:amino acid adenylation domain-containing protein